MRFGNYFMEFHLIILMIYMLDFHLYLHQRYLGIGVMIIMMVIRILAGMAGFIFICSILYGLLVVILKCSTCFLVRISSCLTDCSNLLILVSYPMQTYYFSTLL